jgi:hypothetical protein
MNLNLSFPRRRGPLPMPDIIFDPRAPACYRPISGSGIAKSQSLDPDLSGLARVARARRQRPFRQAPWADRKGTLLVCCRFAAREPGKPRICATNRENLLQIPCRCSKRSRPSQVFCGFPPAAIPGMQHEQQDTKLALCRRRPGPHPSKSEVCQPHPLHPEGMWARACRGSSFC